MFSEPGPSRYSQPPPDQKYPPRDLGPGGRGPPRRNSEYERDDRPNAFGRPENGSRPYPTSTWRPNPRFGNNAPPRSRTPSPPRGDFDRGWSRPRDGPDPRDRPPLGPRPGGPPDWRGREPWADRRGPPPDRRDERYDSRSTPGSRSSPTRNPGFYGDRQHSPPRGPKERGGAPAGPYPSGPRIPGPGGPYGDRDRSFDRIGFPGRDGERSRDVSSQSAPRPSPPERPPIAPRSMRGSSSPVEAKHTRPLDNAPLSTPTTSIPLPPMDGMEREDGELEEGEVLSPRRAPPPLQPSAMERPVDTFRPRTNFSPQKRDRPIWNERRASPVKRERSESPRPWRNGESVDAGWAARNRRTSAQNSPDKERPNARGTSPPSVPSSDRPPTPPLPTAGLVRSPVEVKGEDPPMQVPEDTGKPADTQGDLEMNTPPKSLEIPVDEQAPIVADMVDALPPPAGELPAAAGISESHQSLPAEARADEKESMDTIIEAAQEVASAVNVTLPNLPSSADTPIPAAEASSLHGSNAVGDITTAALSEAPLAANDSAEPLKSAVIEIPPPVELDAPGVASGPVDSLRVTRSLRNPSPLPRQTLAERRAVVLPPTNGPLSSPFVSKSSRDPAPTGISMTGSIDSEYPLAPAGREDRSDVPMSEREEVRANRLVSSIKQAQQANGKFDPDDVLQWNISSSPTESSRLKAEMDNRLRNKQLRDTTWPLHKTSGDTAKRLSRLLANQANGDEHRVEQLKEEYLELEEEWKAHCKLLDDQMAKRGPPPPELFAFPAILPVVTPGPGAVPTTPVADDLLLSARAIRRRGGGGDGVATEAEYEDILAMLAAEDAKNPDTRARKTTATLPDMLLPWERTMRYDDENDVVVDPLSFYDYSGTKEPIWTDEERAIFLRRYLNFPKQFGKIAEALPGKSASDCVLYYYRTKKEVDYKAMLASRRGVTKKKALPIKKGGKSSALLSDLARQKPTVEKLKPSASARSLSDATTVSRKAKEMGVKRRTAAEADDGTGDYLQTPSRPDISGLGKAKMRVSVKTKRPRISSLPETPGAAGQGTAQTPSQAQNELLPPLKRPRKHRKVDLPDANGVAPDGTPGGTPGDKAPRRGNTSSYWSVEEKKRVRELYMVMGRNIQAIAAEMPGKTERQIGNFVDAHVKATSGGDGGQDSYAKPNHLATMAYERMYPPQHPGGPPTYPSEPRLGVFPTMPPTPSGPTGPKLPTESPIKHVSRPGGMRISALLNDDAADEAHDTRRDAGANDAASDGTVDEQENASRHSPRTAPISMNTVYDSNRQYSGANADRPAMGGYRPPDNRAGGGPGGPGGPGGYGGFWASRPPTYPQGPPPHAPQYGHPPPQHPRSSTGPPPSGPAWDRGDPPPPNVHHNVGQPSMGYFRPEYRERLAPPPHSAMQQTSRERYSPAPPPRQDSHSPVASHARAETTSAPPMDRAPSRESGRSAGSPTLPIKNAPSPHPPTSAGETPAAASPAPNVPPTSAAPAPASTPAPDKPSNQPWML